MRSLRPISTDTAGANARLLAALVACSLILVAVPASAAIIYVDDAGGGDYLTIGEGLGAALPGDTVLVWTGTYAEAGLNMPSDVKLRSQTGDPNDVVIDGSYYEAVMYCANATTDTEIRGITFTHGWAYGNDGAGLDCFNSDVLVEDCVFTQNETFFGNGGGAAVDGGSPVFHGCTFDSNVSDDWGAGMYVRNASPVISYCSFLNNSASTLGGGMALNMSSSPTIGFTIFAGNAADDGGAIYCTGDSDPTAESCTFYDNYAGGSGSAVACISGSSIDLTQSIVVGQTGSDPFYCDESPGAGATLGCCDVWGNDTGDYSGCIAGQGSINNNFSENPYFCDAEAGDLTIHENSPCANTPGCGVVGALGIDCGPRAIRVPTDYATIQGGVDAAAPGDTVLVEPGFYYENVTVTKTQLTILGEEGRQDAVVSGSGSGPVFHFTAEVDSTTILQGFGITDGVPGVECSGSAKIVGNTIWGNSGTFGGGLHSSSASPIVEDNVFTGNAATYGGAMYFNFSTGRIVRNDIDGNTADPDAAGILLHGSSPLIAGNLIRNNAAVNVGGGIRCNVNSNPMIASNTFVGNSADLQAGGIHFEAGETPDISGNIVASNINGGIYCSGTSAATISCNDVWDNTVGDYTGGVPDMTGIDGNFSLDPVFCDPDLGNLDLHESSPCADAPGCGLVGALGVGCGARIWYVPDDAPTIAAAIDSAFAGDTIIVRTGTYAENGLNMKSGVVLQGETGNPDDVWIDGEWGERVFICNGLSADTEIRGFTITNGYTYSGPGGGMYVSDSYLTVENCEFFLNETYMSNGGGVGVSGGAPTLLGCVFANNTAEVSGGGMYVASSSPTIADCWFTSNSAFSGGGGIMLESSSPTITGCVLTGNDAYEGGAFYAFGDSYPDITNCTFYDNDASTVGPAMALEGTPSRPSTTRSSPSTRAASRSCAVAFGPAWTSTAATSTGTREATTPGASPARATSTATSPRIRSSAWRARSRTSSSPPARPARPRPAAGRWAPSASAAAAGPGLSRSTRRPSRRR